KCKTVMVKEPEKDQEPKEHIEWLRDFKPEAIKKASEVDIKPKLTIDGLGIEFAKICTILTLPKKVKIPKEKSIGNSNLIFMMDLEYEGVAHNFICESGSFRFQLGVLMTKLGFTDTDDLIESLGYIQAEYKKKYILDNGLIIKNRRNSTKRLYTCERIIGVDTETYKGTCKLIANSEGKYILNPSFHDCLKFLFYLADKNKTYRFFYNLDFDITSILKLWKPIKSKVRKKW
ncbi:unnamed protein product, partial [marine sediment metagenome]